MITSKRNDHLKLVRKLRERKHRDREGLFVSEGEDLLDAGLAAGRQPELVLSAAGSRLGGLEVDPELLGSASVLGSGSRAIAVWRQRWDPIAGPCCAYLHGIADPGNVGAVIRSFSALLEGTVVLGPGCADPYSPKAVRATMGSIFAQPLAGGDLGQTPEPRLALSAHGGEQAGDWPSAATICLGSERQELPAEVLEACTRRLTIPLRDGAESLNVAAAAAIAFERISSAAADKETAAGA
jgi:TrmH family RNA methyltransferase